MINKLFYFFLVSVFLSSCAELDTSVIKLRTNHFELNVDAQGLITHLSDLSRNRNYIDSDSISSLMALRMDMQIMLPQSATADNKHIILNYRNNIEAQIKVEEKEDYLTFELLSLSNEEEVDLIIWGPYFSTIDKVIGETVGVVRGDEYAFGIQSLNIKTLGGYPWNESDRMPAFDVISEDDPNNMHPKADGSVLYRVEAAKPTSSGSSLQAYCRNRNKPRLISDFKHPKIMAPPHEDGGVVGSKIALFGCSVSDALATLGKIEIAEGLPHPMIDGQWGKQAPGAAAAYIITDFTEDNVDEAIAFTKKAGLKYMYHYGKTFENWGHFDLYKGEFPNGIKGLRTCIEKAEAHGIMVGTHFLSNFITTNDPYVTPIPDKRLAKVGSSKITTDITSTQEEIAIESPDFFNQMENNSLKTVVIGDELIRYGKVSEEAPWKLIDCQRGAFETEAVAHESGAEIAKLLDHAYKVFLTNAELTVELSERMAKLYNETGLRQISFDGLEGNRSTGLGTYGESLMPSVWYDNLDEDLKKHLIIDASRTTHFFWHIYTRMNWGEPWYGGFRESQTEYRFKNQAYFKRNFMPGMLGWFKMTPETSLEDIDWLLARSAGYDAGYAFVANNDAIEKNGNTEGILEKIGSWEKLRISGSFSKEQKELMRDSKKEFTLRQIDTSSWQLDEVNTDLFRHSNKVRQPGEPLSSKFDISEVNKDQSLYFILTAIDCKVKDIAIEINNYKNVKLKTTLKENEKLRYFGGDKVFKYDSEWNVIGELIIKEDDFNINKGGNNISIECGFINPEKEAHLKIETRTLEKSEVVFLKE